jgi:hypothetical protein
MEGAHPIKIHKDILACHDMLSNQNRHLLPTQRWTELKHETVGQSQILSHISGKVQMPNDSGAIGL